MAPYRLWRPTISYTSINTLQIIPNIALRIATGCTQDTNTQHRHDEPNVFSSFRWAHITAQATQPKQLTQRQILETKLRKNEKHQTRVSLLLELVSDAYLTANRTRYMWSSTQETTPLDHASPTTTRLQTAGNDSRLCRARNTRALVLPHSVFLARQSRESFPAACNRVVVGLAWSSGVVSCVEDHM